MADRQRAENTKSSTTRQDRKEKDEVFEDLSAKSYAKKSILHMLLRIVIVIIVIVVAAVIGAMIGYGVIGDGEPMDVLDPSTWTHVFDIMNGTETK